MPTNANRGSSGPSPENVNWNERYVTGDTPWDCGQPSRELQRILQEQAIPPCDALEIGCGTGTNAVYLAQQGFRVTAVDLSPLAIERAKKRAAEEGVTVDFRAANLLEPSTLDRAYPFVFDRGVYHSVRPHLDRFLRFMEQVTSAGSLYLLLAGNANDPEGADRGPPRVRASQLCAELEGLFELVQLREFFFDGIVIEGRAVKPLGWSALLRRTSHGD